MGFLGLLAQTVALGDDVRQVFGGELATGQQMGQGRDQVVAREHWPLSSALDFLLGQEQRRQHHQGHMMMPGVPPAHLIIGQAACALSLAKGAAIKLIYIETFNLRQIAGGSWLAGVSTAVMLSSSLPEGIHGVPPTATTRPRKPKIHVSCV